MSRAEIITRIELRKPAHPLPWTVEHHARNIHAIDRQAKAVNDFEQWILVLGDVHFDSPHCNRVVLSRLLKQAVARDAAIISIGDYFDLMNARGDPRASASGMRLRHMSDAYLDEVIDEAAEYLCGPQSGHAATHLCMLGAGNHESAALKHRCVDASAGLAQAIRSKVASPVSCGGYTGWIRIGAHIGHRKEHFQRRSLNIMYHHGAGGGGGQSGGVLDARRMFTWAPDAQIILASHNHCSNTMGVQRLRYSCSKGVYRITEEYGQFVRVGTLKQEWGADGWAVEKGGGPQPCVQKWIRIFGRHGAHQESAQDTRVQANQGWVLDWEVTDAK